MDNLSDDELHKKIAELTEEFNKLHDETWKSLMENEMHLHESVVETNTTFEHVIQDMMNEFIEQCKSQFVQLRDVESNFVDALSEAVQSFVTTLASTGKEDEIPDELKASLIDRDVINDLASGMRELHMSRIDGREDLLVGRSKKWVEELCDQMMQWVKRLSFTQIMIFTVLFNNRNEIERNRQKVMEINFFLDNQQINFDNLTTKLATDIRDKPTDCHEETDAEPAHSNADERISEIVPSITPDNDLQDKNAE